MAVKDLDFINIRDLGLLTRVQSPHDAKSLIVTVLTSYPQTMLVPSCMIFIAPLAYYLNIPDHLVQ